MTYRIDVYDKAGDVLLREERRPHPNSARELVEALNRDHLQYRLFLEYDGTSTSIELFDLRRDMHALENEHRVGRLQREALEMQRELTTWQERLEGAGETETELRKDLREAQLALRTQNREAFRVYAGHCVTGLLAQEREPERLAREPELVARIVQSYAVALCAMEDELFAPTTAVEQ